MNTIVERFHSPDYPSIAMRHIEQLKAVVELKYMMEKLSLESISIRCKKWEDAEYYYTSYILESCVFDSTKDPKETAYLASLSAFIVEHVNADFELSEHHTCVNDVLDTIIGWDLSEQFKVKCVLDVFQFEDVITMAKIDEFIANSVQRFIPPIKDFFNSLNDEAA